MTVDAPPAVRSAAVQALGYLEVAGAVDALLGALGGQEDLEHEILAAFGGCADFADPVLPTLVTKFRYGNGWTPAYAAAAAVHEAARNALAKVRGGD